LKQISLYQQRQNTVCEFKNMVILLATVKEYKLRYECC